MIAVIALYQLGNLAFLELVQSIGVLGNEVVDLIPTNIAAVLSARGVGGIFLGCIFERDLAGIDLLQNLFGGSFVVGREEDMGGTLSTGKVACVGFQLLEQLGILDLHLTDNVFLELVGKQTDLDGLAIQIFGSTGVGQSLLPLFVGIVVGLHLGNLFVNLGILDGDVFSLASLLYQLVFLVMFDDLGANARGIVAVGVEPLTPRVVAGDIGRNPEVLDVLGNGVLGDFGSLGSVGCLNGCGNSTGITIVLSATTGDGEAAGS